MASERWTPSRLHGTPSGLLLIGGAPRPLSREHCQFTMSYSIGTIHGLGALEACTILNEFGAEPIGEHHEPAN